MAERIPPSTTERNATKLGALLDGAIRFAIAPYGSIRPFGRPAAAD
jgi:hypothetical protein